MANPKARAADYVEGFGLTAHEFELVRSLPDSAHCFLVKHGNESVVVRLDLTGERELLTILSGRERTVRLLDELRAERGDAPDAWYDALMRSEEHTSELQSLMRISYAVFCLKKKTQTTDTRVT